MLSLDLTDAASVALATCPRRIATLLTDTTVLAKTDLAGSLDDFLGAIDALIQPKQQASPTAPRPSTLPPLKNGHA